ncbi:hypothetical protein [Scytonema sp. PCC 10023]|uniref:VMAP-C domain-containing protein n=1 Tax=Scytonema sp. PCC 10023 TaxID=1680591 RepID=UPI0039C681B0
MPLTDDQCETLRDAILNVYPYEKKADLENLLSKKFNAKLEFTVSFSAENLNQTIPKDNKKRNRKIKILVFQTSATNLKLNKEFSEIELAINRASNRSLFKNAILKPVYSIDDIRRQIADENPQIVHFCGHAEDGSLKLENDSNESLISPEVLKSIFEGREDIIKCVLLNACDSAAATVAISHHIDYVIGMNNKIIDEVAIEFAKGFYDGLGFKNNNKDIFLMAFNEGIRAIIAKDNSQKFVPLLKKRISYEDAVLKVIKYINSDNQVDKFIEELKSLSSFFNNKSFMKFYLDYSYPIKRDDLNQLLEIIRGIKDFNLVQSSYRETLPKNSTRDNSELNNPGIINNIVDILRKDFPEVGNNKAPSILVFAKNLAGKFTENSQEYQKIKSWVEKVSSPLNISISIQPKDECSWRVFYTYLLIIVDAEGDKFNLRAEYLIEGESLNKLCQEPFNLPGHNEQTGIICNSFNEIPNKVKQYHDELFSQLEADKLKNITIELFLPLHYLTKNLDKEWFIYDETLGKSPIVTELNIVVRLRERLKDTFRKPLENNFDRFKRDFNEYSDEDLLNKEIEIINQKVVDGNFRKISDNFKDKKISVKLNYNDIPDEAFFKAVIRGATVIAFWRRCSIPENRNFCDIDDYFKLEYFKNDFRNLIEKLHELRRNAYYNDNDEKFYPLGFLCDHPNRIPNINTLKSF